MKNKLPIIFANNCFSYMAKREAKLAEVPGAVGPKKDSPARFEIIQEKLKRGDDTKEPRIIPLLMSNLIGVNRSIKSIKKNHPNQRRK
jgi:hypothetical protein